MACWSSVKTTLLEVEELLNVRKPSGAASETPVRRSNPHKALRDELVYCAYVAHSWSFTPLPKSTADVGEYANVLESGTASLLACMSVSSTEVRVDRARRTARVATALLRRWGVVKECLRLSLVSRRTRGTA